jgi:filamentous hemagglutinin family protein
MICKLRTERQGWRAGLLTSAGTLSLALAGVAGLCAPAAAAPALPTGGRILTGTAVIGASAADSLTINQSSARAVIDWTSFSIGSGGSVRFNNGTGATLNRVIGGARSLIDGSLSASGSVYLLNPDGLIIGKGGVIAAGGTFVGSSLDLSNDQFMAGGALVFSGAGGASVVNAGDITAATGDVALIGGKVENDGQIHAPDGTVGLAAGVKVAMRAVADDDGKLSVLIGGAGTSATNAGLITAANAELRANGGNVYALAVGAGSKIAASGVSVSDGRVFLTADGGSVTAHGEIDATRADGSGGEVETSGAAVDFTGLTVRAGNWLIDPVTLTVDSAAATTIDSNLATTSVTLKTTASSASGPGVQSPGAGDIIVDAPISWSSGSTLTLDAYHAIAIDAPVTASGTGKIVLTTNDGGSGGGYGFAPGASITFTGAPGAGQALTINGQAYTLVYSQADLTNINNNLAGFYALARPLDLSGTIFTAAPIANASDAASFTGTFTGLGDTISNLTIIDMTPVLRTNANGPTNGAVGLFGAVAVGGLVENINLVNATVTGGDGMGVGALVGGLGGTVINSSSSGLITTGSGFNTGSGIASAIAGGLVGGVGGAIVNSHSSATVTGDDAFVGGLAGATGAGASIAGSYATGNVTTGGLSGTQGPAAAGGLVGILYGLHSGGVNPLPTPVTGSYATGNVRGGGGSSIGGFVGDVIQGQIDTSYATGSVTQTAGGQGGIDSTAGGFAGYVGPGGVVAQSWSSGAVNVVGSSGAPIPGDPPGINYVTLAGGFVGDMDQASTVSQSYALGSLTSTGSNFNDLGGFAGIIITGAGADHVYATGHVSGPGLFSGGLVGLLGCACATPTTGFLTDSYWDEGTTGLIVAVGGGTTTPTNVFAVGGSGPSAYAAASYANFDLAGVWYLIEGSTRPILRSEYSTTITNVHQLQLMNLNLAANYTLANDIDASETSRASGVWNSATGFSPVGATVAAPFTGILDGQGRTISNLTIIDTTPVAQTIDGSPTNGFVGLIGYIAPGGVARNITLANAQVTGGDGMFVGALAGVLGGSVTNAASSGAVATGNADIGATSPPAIAGGLVGGSIGSITSSSSSASVTGGADAFAGGLVGDATIGASIAGSFATGNVSTGGYSGSGNIPLAGGLVGGLCGCGNPTPVIVTASYATGNVSGGGASNVGGFAGNVIQAQISTSYATGSVTQTAPGQNARSNTAGGFAGAIFAGGVVTQSWSSGAVNSAGGPTGALYTLAGGFVGNLVQGGSVSEAYSLGAVSAPGGAFNVIGGFAGIMDAGGSVDHVYATGLVAGSGTVGGLVGQFGHGGAASFLSNSYWDEGTTGQTVAFGNSIGSTATNVSGVGGSTGHSAYASASYGNFDLANTWIMYEGLTRPVLRSEYSTTITNAHQLGLMELNLAANYTLANDIDASETTNPSGVWNPANGFVPIGGNGVAAFTGSLDGQGHTISNLTIIEATAPSQTFSGFGAVGEVGLVGVLGVGGLVQNISLSNAHVTGGQDQSIGALVGFNLGSVINADSSGLIIGGNGVDTGTGPAEVIAGGLVGISIGAISGSNSSAAVGAGTDAFAGGLVGGVADGGSIAGSHASGVVVTGARTVGAGNQQYALAGGLVGYLYGFDNNGVNIVPVSVTDSYATGPVSGGVGSFVGGFVGDMSQARVTTSYATGPVIQTAGAVSGDNDAIAGGFAGVIDAGGVVTRSWSSGAVFTVGGPDSATPTFAGGFVGGMRLGGTVSNAYATGAVTSTGSAFVDLGGFAGLVQQSAAIDHVYATGLITGSGTVGGLVGQLGNGTVADTSGSLSNSYWDEGTTGQTVGFNVSGTGSATTVLGMGGATGRSPFVDATYAGWDFANTWSTTSAGFYPQLYGVSHVLNITLTVPATPYGEFPIIAVTTQGLQNGDTGQIISGLAISAPSVTNASSGFINAGAYGLSGASASASGASGVYRILYTSTTADITPINATATLAGTVEKTYDGTTAATLAGANYQLSGVVAGDAVTLNDPTGGTYDTKDVGTGKTVTVGGLALTGSDAGNYTVNVSAFAPIGIIDPAALNALIASLTGTVAKTYDGTTAATLTPANYVLSGTIVAGDNVALNDPTSGTYDTRNVGTGKMVTVTGLALTGAQASDYTVNSSATGSVGTIAAKALTVILIGSVEKTYDGTTGATLASGNYQLAGVVGGDSVSLNDPSSGAYDTKGAGTGKVVNVSGLVLGGSDSGNYTVGGSASGGVGVIDPKSLVATLTGAVAKTYDGTTSATPASSNFQLAGVIAGDNVAANDPSGGSYDSKNVGVGKTVSVAGIVLTGSDASDYTVNSTTSGAVGTISAKALTVTLIGSVEKTYDGTTGATLAAGTPLAPGNYQLAGVIAGDTVTLNDPTSGAYDSKSAGSGKTVSVSGLAIGGADSGNYTVASSASGGVGVVDPKSLTATLTGTVQKTFDGTTSATLTPANYLLSGGVVAGDNVALNDPSAGTYDSSSPGTGKNVSVSAMALTGSDASDYSVNNTTSANIGEISAASTPAPPIQTNIVTVSPAADLIADTTTVSLAAPLAPATASSGDGEAAPTSVVGIFPVIGAPPSDFIAGDASPVTGAGNRDLWPGSDLGQPCPDPQKECDR